MATNSFTRSRRDEFRPTSDAGQRSAAVGAIPAFMIPALRSDHAGEVGAVEIYRGILAVTRDDAVRAFATRHLVSEKRHLELLEKVLPSEDRTRLLPLCRWAGWATGALPALFGAPAVYRTIEAVESFVDGHYLEQVVALDRARAYRELRDLLQSCRSDEIAHRDDARSRLGPGGLTGSLWSFIVTLGSRAGVGLAKRF